MQNSRRQFRKPKCGPRDDFQLASAHKWFLWSILEKIAVTISVHQLWGQNRRNFTALIFLVKCAYNTILVMHFVAKARTVWHWIHWMQAWDVCMDKPCVKCGRMCRILQRGMCVTDADVVDGAGGWSRCTNEWHFMEFFFYFFFCFLL